MATRSQNIANRAPLKSGQLKGVAFCKDSRRWAASIRANGKSRYIGTFDTADAAHAAYAREAKKEFDKFASFE